MVNYDPNDPNQRLKNEETSKSFPQNRKEEWKKSFNQSTPRDIVAYILLILGLILLIPFPIYGGVLIGLVAGIYFAGDILAIFKNYNNYRLENGFAKSVILAGTALAFLILAPPIILGMAIAICLRILIVDDRV